MMPGPAPKPTSLKISEGNPGKRPLNRREPKPRQRRPKAPAHLSAGALREWRRVVRMLTPMGVLTEAEADVLAVYAQTYDIWVQASEQLARTGLLVANAHGTPMRNPLLKVVDDAIRTMQRCMGELGMTPSARTRLVATRDDEDPFDAFLSADHG